MTSVVAELPIEPAENYADGNPLRLVQMALEKGADPDKLEKLLDLARTWKAERAAEEFADAMNQSQRLMPCIVKDRENSFTKSRYASLENVNTVIRPVYTQHGFSLIYGQEDSNLTDHVRIVCDVSHVGGCTKRYHLDMPIDAAGMKGGSNKSPAQAMGSTISYGRRYLACLIFNLTVANEDTDAEAADALDAITEPESLEIEDLIRDSGTNRHKFLEWCASGGHLVGGEKLVTKIRAKSFAHVIETLNRKKGQAKS